MTHLARATVVALGLGTLLTLAMSGPAAAKTDVFVTNTPTDPVPTRDVDHPARHAYQGNMNINSGPIIEPPLPEVPLVIEFVSGRCTVAGGGKAIYVNILTTTGGVTSTHYFVPILTGTDLNNTNYHAISQQTRIYHDGGAVGFGGGDAFAGGGGGAECLLTISGHTVTP